MRAENDSIFSEEIDEATGRQRDLEESRSHGSIQRQRILRPKILTESGVNCGLVLKPSAAIKGGDELINALFCFSFFSGNTDKCVRTVPVRSSFSSPILLSFFFLPHQFQQCPPFFRSSFITGFSQIF